MGTKQTRRSTLDRDQAVIGGIHKHLANQSFVVGDQTYTSQQIVDVFQGRVNTGLGAQAARATYRAAVMTDREQRSGTSSFVTAFLSIVRGMFKNPATLEDFGLSPRKSTKTSVGAKAEAIAKSKATREARGTRGSKQKAKIKGTVPAQPAAAPSAPTKPSA